MSLLHRSLIMSLSAFMLLAFSSMPVLAAAQGKKALLIVAKDDFEQTEYAKTAGALEEAGVICTVASTQTGTLKGNSGKRIEAQLALPDVVVADYDAVVIIGGNGIKKLWQNEDALRIVREAANQGKVIGAICAAPAILGNAGVLQGKKATANPRSGAKPIMTKNGCVFSGKDVVVDGSLVTATDPGVAGKFGKALVTALD